jgi:hypothetical protein
MMASMTSDETYEGWSNRETWAVALWINNDQGWQESVHEALRAAIADNPNPDDEIDGVTASAAGEIIRDNVEETLDLLFQSAVLDGAADDMYRTARDDIGSLWRVNWDELGAAFLTDLAEQAEQS